MSVQQRYIFTLMACLGVIIVIHNRMVLSIALPEMVAEPVGMKNNTTDKSNSSNNTDAVINWSEETQGLIMGALYWQMALLSFPTGILANRFTGSQMFMFSIGISTLGNALTPTVAYLHVGWLFALRIIMGIGQTTFFIGIGSLISRWVPKLERGLLGGIIFTGVEIGGVTCSFSTGGILALFPGQWPLTFYFNAFLGAVWLVIWAIFCSSDPSTNRFITEKELQYLNGEINVMNKPPPVPWRKVFTSKPLWAGLTCNFGLLASLFLMVLDLPKFLRQTMHFSVIQETIWTTVPFLLFSVSAILVGYLSDELVANKLLSMTATRKIAASISAIGVSIAYLGITFCGSNESAVIGFICFGFITLGGINSIRLLLNDLTPNYVGAIYVFLTTITGIIASIMPIIAGMLVPNQTMEEWKIVFWSLPVLSIVTLCIYLKYGSAEVEPWDYSISNNVITTNIATLGSQLSEKKMEENESVTSPYNKTSISKL